MWLAVRHQGRLESKTAAAPGIAALKYAFDTAPPTENTL